MRNRSSLHLEIACSLAAILGMLQLAIPARADGWCYRGAAVTTYSTPAKAVTHSGYGYSHGYGFTYVPYAVEVQVNKDRYYSLSDLYRDRLYLEAFDVMRDMRQKLSGLKPETASVGPMRDERTGELIPPGIPLEKWPDGSPKKELVPAPTMKRIEDTALPGKTTPAALAVLQSACYSCHNADTAATEQRPNPLRLDDPDAVPAMVRWAAFGMAAPRRMPPAPVKVREKGGQDLADWQAKNGLKDEQLKALFDGWVSVAAVAKK